MLSSTVDLHDRSLKFTAIAHEDGSREQQISKRNVVMRSASRWLDVFTVAMGWPYLNNGNTFAPLSGGKLTVYVCVRIKPIML